MKIQFSRKFVHGAKRADAVAAVAAGLCRGRGRRGCAAGAHCRIKAAVADAEPPVMGLLGAVRRIKDSFL